MFWNDLRYAVRLMRRAPGFTVVAVLSLALGIGANTAIFSLFYTVMLHQLPVAHPEQLVEFLNKDTGRPRDDDPRRWDEYENIRDHSQVFSDVTGVTFDNLAKVRTDGGDPETIILENVLGNYFAVLGLKPAIGRLTTVEDVPARGDADVVVVSWDYCCFKELIGANGYIPHCNLHRRLDRGVVATRDTGNWSGEHLNVATDIHRWRRRNESQNLYVAERC